MELKEHIIFTSQVHSRNTLKYSDEGFLLLASWCWCKSLYCSSLLMLIIQWRYHSPLSLSFVLLFKKEIKRNSFSSFTNSILTTAWIHHAICSCYARTGCWEDMARHVTTGGRAMCKVPESWGQEASCIVSGGWVRCIVPESWGGGAMCIVPESWGGRAMCI